MTIYLKLVKRTDFHGLTFDCYRKTNEEDSSNFWAIREQIGQLLGYNYPKPAIRKIHGTHYKRLNKFSQKIKLSYPNGKEIYTRIYNFRGLLELCRFSKQQQNVSEVIDFLWHVSDEIKAMNSCNMKSNYEDLPVNNRHKEYIAGELGTILGISAFLERI